MDKQEYRVILDEINRAYLDENYDRVLMIAQELDVNKISDNHILEIIADSYEQMGRADIAREVLLIAYERTPMGRQMAYKLCDISIKMNDLDNAAEFYHDFCRMAPNDSKKYILKYEIGKKGGVARKNLVEVLETYCEKEMDEKYKYELANLYRATGRKEECIELCDEIMLWFAEGAYAKKAQKLKDACLGILQQNQTPKKRGTLSLFDDDNIEDIPDEEAKQYTQPKSEEIFDDAPAVEIQRLEDKPLMNENVSWRMPKKEFDPVITEPEPRLAGGLSFNDFDNSYDEKVDDYENYYNSGNSWKGVPENKGGWTMIEESIQRGWTDPNEVYEEYDDYDQYDDVWEMPDDFLESEGQTEFVEPVFGAHRPAHLRDDYIPPEDKQQTSPSSPFAMPNRNIVNGNTLGGMPLQPVPQSPAYSQAIATPLVAPTPAPASTYTPQPYDVATYAAPSYEEPSEPVQEEPSLLGAKPFAFSIAPDAASQNEIIPNSGFVESQPNMSEKASLVKKPVLKVGPVNEIKYKVPGGEYKTPQDIQVVQYEQPSTQEVPQTTNGTLTSNAMRQTSIPAPKTLSPEPVKVVMGPEGSQPSLKGRDGRISLGWDDNWGGDFKTWGSLNMNDAPQKTTEIDDEPDYFSTMLEIPRDKPSYSKNDIPFAQQVPQTKFVELKSGTPFADPRSLTSQINDAYSQEPVEYIPKRAGVISAALDASTVAAIATEPEENLTETQKAIRAFGAGELTTDDLLERDDLDLGDDELNEEDAMPSDYGYNDEWQESEKAMFGDDSSELRRFRNSGEKFDFEPEFEDDYDDDFENDYDEGPELTEAEKAIMAFDAMNRSSNELVFDDEDEEDEFEEDEEELVSKENDYIDYENEFDEFDDQFEETKKPKVIEEEWTDSDMPEEELIIAPTIEETSLEQSRDLDEEPEEFEEEFEEPEELEEEFEESEEFEEEFEESEEFEEEFEESEELEEEFEEPEEIVEEKSKETKKKEVKQEELSEAEKAILAFDAAGSESSDDEEFDFDEDFDDVFNGEFDGEYTKEEAKEPELSLIFGEEKNKESKEFEEELEDNEEFSEEYEEEFDEEYEDSEEFEEEYDETKEYDEYEEYEDSEEFEKEYDDSEEFEEVKEAEEEFEEDNEQETEVESEDTEESEETGEESKEAEAESEEETKEVKEEIPDMEVEIPDDLKEELSEFFLVEGMQEKIENTLSDIVNAKNKGNKLDANLIVAGDPKSGKTYLTIALIKAIGKILGNGNGRVAKVPAAALRGKKMEKVFEKVVGSDLIIENVGYLDEESIKDLIETLKAQKYESMVVLEGNNLAIENLTSKFPEINDIFKNRLDIDELSLPQWADIASNYANEQGYVIGDMASLALHAKIDELNVPTRRLGTVDIMEIVDDAIENANKRLSAKVIKKKKKKQEDIELVEDDFA